MSVSGTVWGIDDPITGSFTASFRGFSATSGTWVDLNNPEHRGPWRQSEDVLLFKGPLFVWGAHVDGSRMHGVLDNFSGLGGPFNGVLQRSGVANQQAKK